MLQICSPRGIVDYDRPGQAVNDLKKAGFTDLVLDFSLDAEAHTLEKLGKSAYRSDARSIAVDDPKRLGERMRAYIEKVTSLRMSFSIAQAPFLLRNTKHNDLDNKLLELTKQSIIEAAKVNCHYLIVRPWTMDKEIYRELNKLAAENDVMILMENQCKDFNGHLVRGFLSDETEAKKWLDELNEVSMREFGSECFGLCINVGTLNLCAQNMYDYAVTLGDRIKAVVLRDCDGNYENSLLPYTVANKGASRTDWLNLIRGLRKIGFDGLLILDMADTAAVTATMIRPALFTLAKGIIDYFSWQIGMELMLARYGERVLFGAGNMCRNYMKNYGKKYPPLYTCDNNSAIWGEEFEGLTIHNPEDLKALPEDVVIFICNIYYREIEEQLRNMGLKNPIEFFNDEYMPSFNFDRLDSLTRKSDKEAQ